jgi:hypothetical protein
MLTAIRQRLIGRDDVELHVERFAAPPVVDGEIKRFVADYVAEEIDSPASQEAKLIDVAAVTESAWDTD